MAGLRGDTPPGYTLPTAAMPASRAHEYANKRLFLKLSERMFVHHDLGAIETWYVVDYVNNDPGWHARAQAMGLTDRQMTRAFFQQLFDAIPDLKLTVEELYAEADKAIAATTWRGTNEKPLFGAPPTGQPVTIRAADIFRIGTPTRLALAASACRAGSRRVSMGPW